MSRQGSSAAGRAARSQAELNSLPEPLLALILERLPLETRIGRCSLVSHRWHAICHSSQLLHTVRIGRASASNQLLPKLRSLQSWLRRHASQVGCLFLDLNYLRDVPAEAHTLVGGMLATCSAAGRLRSLSLNAGGWPIVVTSWAAGLSRLETLNVSAHRIEVTVSLEGLKSLKQLQLDGHEMAMLPSVRLPPGLTHVELCNAGPPSQIWALPALRSLSLCWLPEAAVAGVSGLTNLAGSLRRLSVSFCARLPPGLSALTGLQELEVEDFSTPQAAADVGPAIANLSQLTCLWLYARGLEPPPQLANLTSLQRLFFCRGDPDGDKMDEDEFAKNEAAFPDGVRPGLPGGAWLSGLTRLSLSLPQLLASLDVLQGATQLQQLVVLRVCCTNVDFFFNTYDTEWWRLWEWVAALQPLSELWLPMCADVWCGVLDGLLSVAQRRPDLCIIRPSDTTDMKRWFYE